jgi:hypothetical protein
MRASGEKARIIPRNRPRCRAEFGTIHYLGIATYKIGTLLLKQ